MDILQRDESTWVLQSHELEVELDALSLALAVNHKPTEHRWQMPREGPHDLTIKTASGTETIDLSHFQEKHITRIAGGLEVELGRLPVVIQYLLREDPDTLIVRLVPTTETPALAIVGSSYPRPFLTPAQETVHTVIPMGYGFLIPGNWTKDIPAPSEAEPLTMPWWGVLDDKAGFLAAVENDADMALGIVHPAGGPTQVYPRWLASMGKLAYPRVVSYQFVNDADHVTLAKLYRKLAHQRGRLRLLSEKAEENPQLERFKGAPLLTQTICVHDRRTFTYQVTSFTEVASRLQQFKKKTKLNTAVLLLAGWGRRGRDNLYPDVLPPCLEAGGVEGLRGLAAEVEKQGYLLALEDNYYDIYFDAPSFEEKYLIKGAGGKFLRDNSRAGGLSSTCCVRAAQEFLRRNLEVGGCDCPSLLTVAEPHAYYLDRWLRTCECYDPEHPLTRSQCREILADIFEYLGSKKLVVGTQAAQDWIQPYLDFKFANHPWQVTQEGSPEKAEAVGVPIPLTSLVYSDALLLPGQVTGNTEVAKAHAFLFTLMTGNAPLVKLPANQDDWESVNALSPLWQFADAVAFQELESHKFLTSDLTIQQTRFALGAEVEVDFSNGEYAVRGVEKLELKDNAPT